MNTFSLLALLSSMCCIAIGASVYFRDTKNPTNRVFALLSLSLAYWAVVQFGYHQSQNYEEALLWRQLDSFRSVAIGFILHFVLLFTEKTQLLKRWWIYLLIYGPVVGIVTLEMTTTLITGPPIEQYWGWTSESLRDNLVSRIVSYWLLAVLLLPIYLVIRFYFSPIPFQKRKQASLILLGMAFAVSFVVTEEMLMLFGIRIPPFSVMALTITSLFIGYGMWKYRLFSLTPAGASEKIVSTMTDTLLMVDPSGNILSINEAAERLLGYEKKAIPGKHVNIIFPHKRNIPPWLASKLNRNGTTTNNEADSVNDLETSFVTKNNRIVPVSLAGTALHDDNGNIQGFLLIGRDITKRKQAEEALKESKEQFQALFNNSLEISFVCDLKSNLLDANDSSLDLFGYTRKELRSLSLADLLVDTDITPAMKQFSRVVETGIDTGEQEYHLRSKDGQHIWLEATGVRIDREGKPSVILGVARNVTKRKQAEKERITLEQQLQQVQKMEAVGRLAGGVAHDMNNVLAAIMGAASAIDLDRKSITVDKEDIETILQACINGRDLMRNLLGFARKGKYIKEDFSLNEVVKRTSDLLTRTVSKKIIIKTILDDALDFIEGDPSQLEHALMNVCINASDAMDSQGELTIGTKNRILEDAENATLHGLEPGKYVELKVIDTGMGMDPKILANVFEPFFTTKPKGRGTGLGLSMVYGAIQNHGGNVAIDSKPGEGTTVTILLPALKRDSKEPPTKRVSKIPSPPSNGGFVLVIDDEELIRKTTSRLLEKLGYTTQLASDGKTALEIFKRKKEHISFVVLDLIMPKMDGYEVFERIMKIDNKTKILLSSGYTRDEKVEKLLSKGTVGFIQKPFDIETLSTHLKVITN